MNLLLPYLHILLLAWAFYSGYEVYNENSVKIEGVKERNQIQRAKLKKTERQLKQVKKFQENLEESKSRVKEVVEKISEMQKQLPSDIKDIEVTGNLTDFATMLKMVNPEVTPAVEVNRNFYFSKDYNLDMQGTYLQALIFFEKLENLSKQDRILNVKYLKLSVSESADSRSRFKILDQTTTVEAYRYNEYYDATKDIQEEKNKVKKDE